MKRARTTHIREILDSSNLPLKARLLGYKIQCKWSVIVGLHLSKRSSPLKLLKSTLYVNVSSQAWMTEFQYQKAEILERINKELSDEPGAVVIKDIIFRQGKLAKPVPYKKKVVQTKPEPIPLKELTGARKDFIEKTLCPIKDKALRELIYRTMARAGD